MTDDVLIGEMDESDAFDVLQDNLGFFDPGALVAGEVDLGLVAGDDRF